MEHTNKAQNMVMLWQDSILPTFLFIYLQPVSYVTEFWDSVLFINLLLPAAPVWNCPKSVKLLLMQEAQEVWLLKATSV